MSRNWPAILLTGLIGLLIPVLDVAALLPLSGMRPINSPLPYEAQVSVHLVLGLIAALLFFLAMVWRKITLTAIGLVVAKAGYWLILSLTVMTVPGVTGSALGMTVAWGLVVIAAHFLYRWRRTAHVHTTDGSET